MKKVIVIVLIVLAVMGALGGSIFGIVKLTDGSKFDTKKLSKTEFSVGGLDGSGKYMNTNGSIYTKDAFECQGLEANLAFDSSVEYQIYFYDQNNDFVHTTGKRANAFVKTEVPFFAKYARIVITPKDDDVVSKIEVSKYAKQLTVKVNREQGFKNYTENLFEVDMMNVTISSETGVPVASESSQVAVSKYINIASYSDSLMFRDSSVSDISHLCLYLYDASKRYLGYTNIGRALIVSFVSSESTNYYQVSLGNLNPVSTIDLSQVVYMRIASPNTNLVKVHCR